MVYQLAPEQCYCRVIFSSSLSNVAVSGGTDPKPVSCLTSCLSSPLPLRSRPSGNSAKAQPDCAHPFPPLLSSPLLSSSATQRPPAWTIQRRWSLMEQTSEFPLKTNGNCTNLFWRDYTW